MTETFSIPINQTKEFQIMKKSYDDLIELGEKIKKDFEHTYKRKADKIIDAWYNSYNQYRHMYRPTGSLKQAYQIEFDGDKIYINMGAEYITVSHHQDNEIIYNNMFVEGYHGGSWGTDNPVDISGRSITKNDGPHFRTPAKGENKFKFWGNAAVKSSIGLEEALTRLYDEVFYEIKNKYISKVTNIISDFMNAKKALGL